MYFWVSGIPVPYNRNVASDKLGDEKTTVSIDGEAEIIRYTRHQM
jgi:hypothetical protein